MSIALMSVIALFIAIIISCFLPYNVGFLSIAFSFFIGVIYAGMKVNQIISGFPTGLFVILVGVTYLFGIAQTNGTLDRVANTCIRAVRGRASLLPIVFFILGFAISAAGPGAIPATALLAPPAMLLASKLKINPFLMGIFVANGANAAAMSPITPCGAVAYGVINKLGLPDMTGTLFMNTVIANLVINAIAYFLFGGLDLLRREKAAGQNNIDLGIEVLAYEKQHHITLIGIFVMMVGALGFNMHVGLLGIGVGVILILLGCGDEKKAINAVPWGTVMLVCGVTVLIELMNKTGGMKMFIDMMATISSPDSLVFVVTVIPGIISAYASTTGVVFPAFLPLMPGLTEQVGGDLIAVLSGCCLGSLIVDASPLSTLGALVLGAATPEMDKAKLFNQLLAWGLSMAFIGGAVAWLIF